MTIFVYSYSDPLLDAAPEPELWGVEVDRIYSDWGQRQQLTQLLTDLDTGDRPDYLLLRRLDELGENLSEIGDRLQHIENYGVGIIATEQDYQSDQPLDQKALGQLFQTIGDRLRQQKIQRGHAKNRRQFLPPPGKAPYGYKRGQDRYLIDRSTAPVVKDFSTFPPLRFPAGGRASPRTALWEKNCRIHRAQLVKQSRLPGSAPLLRRNNHSQNPRRNPHRQRSRPN